MQLIWLDYILLGIMVLIPALLLWRAWTVKRQADLETPFARLIVMTLAGWLAWFLATIPFSLVFMACCDTFYYPPLKLAMTRWLYNNTLGAIFTPNFWAVPLLLFLVGLLGFALAKFRLDIAIIPLGVVSFIPLVIFATTGSTLASIMPDAKGVPLYPGSEDGLVNNLACDACGISFVAPAEPEVVSSFYQRELPKGGWHRGSDYGSPYLLAFERSETENGLSWRFGLLMRISLQESKNSYVSVYISRHSDVQKLPVYPGAHDAKITEERLPDDVLQRTTTYMVSAQPKEVEAWYRSIVLDDRAWKEETESEHVGEGLLFRFYPTGGWFPGNGVQLTLIARQDSSGQTQVELRGVDYAATTWFPD